MKDFEKNCKLALVQAEPVMFNKELGTAKVIQLIEEAAESEANLIVFPELFIPGYPAGMNFGFSVGKRTEKGRKEWKKYYDNSCVIPGAETEKIGQAAKVAQAYVSIGISERDQLTDTLYNSNVIFSPAGEIVAVHRKLKPTGSERVVWGDANKGYFPIVSSPWGNMGSLICWESYMPLARAALYQKGVSLYISPNTNDNPEWQATIQHIAIEGHCYFINADMLITKASYPQELRESPEIKELPEVICRGGSCVIDPFGHYLTEPVWDQETIIYTNLDMEQVPMSRMEFDVCGHYARPDVLNLVVDDK